MQKNNPQVVRTKKWLTESLIALMDEKPFAKISIQELVDRAQVSRSAFYTHYTCKEDILFAKVADIYVTHIEGCISTHHHSQLENFISTAQMYWDNRKLFQLINQNKLQTIVYDAEMSNYSKTSQLVAQTIQSEPEDRELYYSVFVPYHRRAEVDLVLRWLSSDHPASVEEMGNLICSFCCVSVYDAFRKHFYNNRNFNLFSAYQNDVGESLVLAIDQE